VEHAGDATPGSASPPRSAASTLRTHLTLAAGLALCAAAFWFELHRALGGNQLSWAYVFEWPLLGAFGVYMWWRVLHPADHSRKSRETPVIPEVERMRAAWEEYQQTLHVEAEPGHSDVPGHS
jgi:hypothetical protein